MSQANTVFVQGLVQRVAALATSTYVTKLPKPASGQPAHSLPYALIHPSDGTDEATRATGPATTEHPEYTVHLVGSSAEQCQILADLLKAEVKPNGSGVIPEIEGRTCGHLYWRNPIPIQTDTDVTPPICFYVAEIGWRSDPA